MWYATRRFTLQALVIGLALTLFLGMAGTATAGTATCAIGGGNVPAGWTLNGVGGGVSSAVGAPFLGPSGASTDCYIVTDSGAGWPGTTSTGFPMSGTAGDPGIAGTTNGSQMISPWFTSVAGQRLIFDFMFATNDGTETCSDWASAVLEPFGGGPALNLFTARTWDTNQVVPGFGFTSLAPGLVLTPGTATLIGDQWCLDPTTGAASSGAACTGDQTQYGPGRYPGDVLGPYTGGSSDWSHAVFTFSGSNEGQYRMVMSVSNVGDEIYSSAFFFTGSSFSGGSPLEPGEEGDVPEPSTLALLGGGLLLGCFFRLRARK
jgi:hypothetical protein